jgi:membrane protein implicated in regulation of membrane protease activity
MLKPFGFGSVMAVMMLWMLHEPIMSGEMSVSLGALGFVLAHVAIAALGLFVPGLRRVLSQHRPSLQHMATMLAGMVGTAGSIHFALHGFA